MPEHCNDADVNSSIKSWKKNKHIEQVQQISCKGYEYDRL